METVIKIDPSTPVSWPSTLLGMSVGMALVLLAMWPSAHELIDLWQSREAYRYGWLVLPTVVYLLGWNFRDELCLAIPVPGYSGVFLGVIAGLGWVCAILMNIGVIGQFMMILALHAVILAALGWRLYWRIFPVTGLLFLMTSGADLVQPLLRRLTVQSIDVFTSVVGIPHRVDGYTLFVGRLHYVVVDNCSGLSYFNLMLFLGWSFGLLLFRSLFKVAAITVLAIGLGLLSNVLRVNSIVVMDWMKGTQMDLTSHGDVQWITLAIALALLFAAVTRMTPESIPANAPDDGPQRFLAGKRWLPLAAGFSILATTGVLAWLPMPEFHVMNPAAIQQGMALNHLGWAPAAVGQGPVVHTKDDIESSVFTYQRLGVRMSVQFVVGSSPKAKLLESFIAPGEPDTWFDTQSRRETICTEGRCLTLVHTIWQGEKLDALRHVYHAYSVANVTTPSRLEARALGAWQRLRKMPGSPQLIALSFDGIEPNFSDVAAAFTAAQVALTH